MRRRSSSPIHCWRPSVTPRPCGTTTPRGSVSSWRSSLTRPAASAAPPCARTCWSARAWWRLATRSATTTSSTRCGLLAGLAAPVMVPVPQEPALMFNPSQPRVDTCSSPSRSCVSAQRGQHSTRGRMPRQQGTHPGSSGGCAVPCWAASPSWWERPAPARPLSPSGAAAAAGV